MEAVPMKARKSLNVEDSVEGTARHHFTEVFSIPDALIDRAPGKTID